MDKKIMDMQEVYSKLSTLAQIDPLALARICGQMEQAKRDEETIIRLQQRVSELEQKAG